MITNQQKSEVRELVNKFSYVIGRKPDDLYSYPKKLGDIIAVQYKNKENSLDYFNGKIGVIIAYTFNPKKTKIYPVTVWAWDKNWRVIPSEKLIEFGTVAKLFKDMLLKDEFLEREKLQSKLKPITAEDFMDFHNELKLFEKGIDIFLKEIKNEN